LSSLMGKISFLSFKMITQVYQNNWLILCFRILLACKGKLYFFKRNFFVRSRDATVSKDDRKANCSNTRWQRGQFLNGFSSLLEEYVHA
jgi:hypothetical protein